MTVVALQWSGVTVTFPGGSDGHADSALGLGLLPPGNTVWTDADGSLTGSPSQVLPCFITQSECIFTFLCARQGQAQFVCRASIV